MLLVLLLIVVSVLYHVDAYHRFSSSRIIKSSSLLKTSTPSSSSSTSTTTTKTTSLSSTTTTESETSSTSTLSSSSSIVPKVPSTAWRWPPQWPFPPDFMDVVDNSSPETIPSETPMIDERFKDHIKNFLPEGCNVLEIGGRSRSLLPNNIKYDNKKIVSINSNNNKGEGEGEGSDITCDINNFSLPYESQSFDRIVFSSNIDCIDKPRDIFREIWRVLKPGGLCMVCFPKVVESLKPVKMWTTMNEEQKIWIVGSYYHYSVGEGFEQIEGYDLFNLNGQMVFASTDANDAAYVVHAKRQVLPEVGSKEFSANDYILGSLHGFKYLESDDKKFNALRLAADYERSSDADAKSEILKTLNKLEQIYEVIHVVKEMIIPAPVKAMLANFLYPKWTNIPEQRDALKQGLGLSSPPDDFWKEVGKSTSSMSPRQKVIFLSNIIPFFGSASSSDKLAAYPGLLIEIIESIQLRLPTEAVGLVQDFASDFLVTDFLASSKGAVDGADRVKRYLEQLSTDDLKKYVTEDRQTKVF